MDIGLRQDLRQKQILSQQLKQSLLILQLGAIDLETHLNEELETNPLLERDQDPVLPSRMTGDISFIREHQASLGDNLRRQLYQVDCPTRVQVIADYLINYLDDAGYLELELSDPKLSHLSPDSLGEAIAVLQSLEPKGIAARSLGECLCLQLEAKRSLDITTRELLLTDLDELAQGNLNRLEDKYDLTRSQLIELLEELQELDPRPGSQLAPLAPEYIIPDIIIHSVDPLDIELAAHSFPSLKFSHVYDDYMKLDDSKDFLSQKQSRAKLIIYALEQRAITMRRIIEALVKLQPDFFTPSQTLHILNRQAVADELDLHNSTVSRAIQDKYLLWQNRVYPLSDFFPKGVKRYDGTGISSQIIKREIVGLIEHESIHKPLSDQQIARLLEQKGLNIARRTVTKYREQMGIPRANLRQRLK